MSFSDVLLVISYSDEKWPIEFMLPFWVLCHYEVASIPIGRQYEIPSKMVMFDDQVICVRPAPPKNLQRYLETNPVYIYKYIYTHLFKKKKQMFIYDTKPPFYDPFVGTVMNLSTGTALPCVKTPVGR